MEDWKLKLSNIKAGYQNKDYEYTHEKEDVFLWEFVEYVAAGNDGEEIAQALKKFDADFKSRDRWYA